MIRRTGLSPILSIVFSSIVVLSASPACSAGGSKTLTVPDDARVAVIISRKEHSSEKQVKVYDLTKDTPAPATQCVPCTPKLSEYIRKHMKKKQDYSGDPEHCDGLKKHPQSGLPICHALIRSTDVDFGLDFEYEIKHASDCDVLVEKWGRRIYAVPEGCAHK